MDGRGTARAAHLPLLDHADLDVLRAVLGAEFTAETVYETLGPVGRAAHERGDIAGALRELPRSGTAATLVRLFLLGSPAPARDVQLALGGLSSAGLAALVLRNGHAASARHEIRPYGETGGQSWWVVSDFGSDVRPGPLAADHVLGIGGASLTLAQAAMRVPVGEALDVGTGCGVQALHLARHANRVVATDLSQRALRLAATTAALSDQHWDLRAGSLLEPVAGEQFDQIVANPPFVVSPGLSRAAGGYDYRDSGIAGDGVCRELLTAIPARLRPGGSASMMANWVIPHDGDWAARVAGWIEGRGCDAWVWQREVLDVGEYVSLWLRDAGEVPGTPRWTSRYDAWASWLDRAGVPAIGMGLVTLWRHSSDQRAGTEIIRCEDVAQAIQQPAGLHIAGWVHRQRWLARTSDAELLQARLRAAPDLVREQFDVWSEHGWASSLIRLRQSHGMRWELDSDEAIAGLVGACNGSVSLGFAVDVLAASLDTTPADVSHALVPIVRDLVARGFLEPDPHDVSAR